MSIRHAMAVSIAHLVSTSICHALLTRSFVLQQSISHAVLKEYHSYYGNDYQSCCSSDKKMTVCHGVSTRFVVL